MASEKTVQLAQQLAQLEARVDALEGLINYLLKKVGG